MLTWSVVFFVIAIIAGLFGFTTIYIAAASVAKIIFFIFVVLFIISLITNYTRGRRVPPPRP